MREYELTPADLRAQRRLRGFLPENLFDIHAHIYDCAFLPSVARPGTIQHDLVPVADADRVLSEQSELCGGVTLRANLIVFPDRTMADPASGTREASTQFLKRQLERHPECVGEVFVIPSDTKRDVEQLLVHPNIRGFKCYHVAASRQGDTFEAEIADYLPESAWQVAEERGLCITLHLVKRDALANPGNLTYVRRMARAYPNAKLILAHAARGFAAWTALDAVRELAEEENILFDLAAVCESPPMIEVIRRAGSRRVLWGSDYPISLMRGKCVSVADSFLWLDEKQLDASGPGGKFEANLVGLENLLAFQQAAYLLDLSKDEVEDIFYRNAMRLFRLEE